MNPTAKCRSCGAAIIWCVTGNGKKMPIDARPTDTGNLVLEGTEPTAVYVDPGTGTHTSHFATCPNADKHRRSKGQGSLPGVG